MSSKPKQKCESIWTQTATKERRYPRLVGAQQFDVVVIGAGITGLTTGLMLKEQGLRIAVIEAGSVGAGTTGLTSAHLSSLWDGRFSVIAKKFGEDNAQELKSGLGKAIDHIEGTISKQGIDCDFKRVDGYFYADEGQSHFEVEEELAFFQQQQWQAERLSQAPLPFATGVALRVANQAQFNPMKYLSGLAHALHGGNGSLFERSRVIDFTDGESCSVVTESGRIQCDQMVIATHTPLGISFLHTEVTPYQSYVIAFKTSDNFADALYWDNASPYHYLRAFGDGEQRLIILGGADHKTGKGNPDDSFAHLRKYASARFNDVEVVNGWLGQFFEPDDYLPFIGLSPFCERSYVATGFSGDGLTSGTMAAKIICDELAGRQNSLAKVLSPARLPLKGVGRFLKNNSAVAADYLTGYLGGLREVNPTELKVGEGAVTRAGLSKVAYYRDRSGQLHTFSAVCPHMKAIVQWNSARDSFECSCHGSRFSPTGEVLEGPSLKPLSKLHNETSKVR